MIHKTIMGIYMAIEYPYKHINSKAVTWFPKHFITIPIIIGVPKPIKYINKAAKGTKL